MGSKILIVDDSRTHRTIVRRTVEALGFANEVIEAQDGLTGLIRLRDHQFDLVLLDVNMPRVDGMEMLEAFRAQDKTTKVVVLSADDKPELKQRFEELGACGFVPKPVDPALMGAAIQRALAAAGD